MESRFDTYGYRFTLTGDAPDALRVLASDFEFFADRGPAAGVSG